jgi:hypothetical protein
MQTREAPDPCEPRRHKLEASTPKKVPCSFEASFIRVILAGWRGYGSVRVLTELAAVLEARGAATAPMVRVVATIEARLASQAGQDGGQDQSP